MRSFALVSTLFFASATFILVPTKVSELDPQMADGTFGGFDIYWNCVESGAGACHSHFCSTSGSGTVQVGKPCSLGQGNDRYASAPGNSAQQCGSYGTYNYCDGVQDDPLGCGNPRYFTFNGYYCTPGTTDTGWPCHAISKCYDN